MEDHMTFDFKQALVDKKAADKAKLEQKYQALDAALKSSVPTKVKEIMHERLRDTYDSLNTMNDYVIEDAIKMQTLLKLGDKMTIADMLLVLPWSRLRTYHRDDWTDLKLYDKKHVLNIALIFKFIVEYHHPADEILDSIKNRNFY
jgi:hypothetical protein